MCDTHKQLLTQLRTSDETPVVRIKKFIDECSSIIVELDLPTLKQYYDAMLLEFLQRSLAAVNAEREDIDDLDSKIMEKFDKFKECAALQ